MQVSELTLTAHGIPDEVLELRDTTLPAPGPGEARVRVIAAVINPADDNICRGTYGVLPSLPAVAGAEGVGVVESVGPDTGLEPGTRVLAPMRLGWWAGGFVEGTDRLIPLHEPDLPDEQAAMLTVNPATAWGLLHDLVSLEPGDWVAQNAANSGVGRCVIQLARQLGIRTINVVRRTELIEELTALGADAVFTPETFTREAVRELTGKRGARLGLNATSGEGLRLVTRCLGLGATIATYGAMSREPFTLGNGSLIFKDLRVRGYWVSRWFQTTPRTVIAERLQALAEAGLSVPVEASYPLAAWRDALAHAAREGRSGKILLRPG